MLASTNGHIEVVQYLLNKNAKLDLVDNLCDGTALMYANLKGYTAISSLLKSAGAGKNDNLFRASKNGDIERIKILIASGIDDINLKDQRGISPLNNVIPFNNVNLVKLFLDNGADPNSLIESNKFTTLMLASTQGNIEIVKLLLTSGANINSENIHGETALYLASFFGHIKIVKLLLESGADPNVATNNGYTAFSVNSNGDKSQKNYKNIKNLLIKYGALN